MHSAHAAHTFAISSVRPANSVRKIFSTKKGGETLTDIVRVELVDSDENAHGGGTQRPGAHRAKDGEFPWVQIVNEDAVKLSELLAQRVANKARRRHGRAEPMRHKTLLKQALRDILSTTV